MLAVRGRPLLPHGSLILQTRIKRPGEGGGGMVPPYVSHISMCRSKGYGFWAFLV